MNTAAHAMPTATPRLPLYLRGQEHTTVDAAGPALAVRRTGKSIARHPIARLSRIISGRNVQWSGRALNLCMQEEIPIVILDDKGSPCGYIQPAIVHRSTLDSLLQQWVDIPHWHISLENWQRAQRIRLVKAWCANRVLSGHDVSEKEFRELVRLHVQRMKTMKTETNSLWCAALAAYVSQKLQEAGAAARYWGHGGDVLDLRGVLLELLEVALALEFAGFGQAAHTNEAAQLRILHAFGKTMNQTIALILGSLHQYIRSQLEEWHCTPL